MSRTARIAGQGDVSARQDAEAAKYRSRTERALKIVAANRPYSHPYAYSIDWMREAAEHAKDEWYIAALLRQADSLGIPVESDEAPAPADGDEDAPADSVSAPVLVAA